MNIKQYLNPLSSRYLSLSFMLIVLLTLLGCGFQPRGANNELSHRFDATYLSYITDPEVGLGREVRRLITYNGGTLVEKDNATVTVSFTPISDSARQVAISGDGSFKEYERHYVTLVQVTDNETGLLLGSQEISTVRYVQEDERKILASEEQREISKKSAAKDIAGKILRYLGRF